jgi:hypothetical protein
MMFVSLPRTDAARAGAARRFALVVGAVLACFVGLTAAFAGSHAPPIGDYTTSGAYSYASAPSLHPPIVHSLQRAPAGQLAPGYIFTTNFFDLNEPPIIGQSGPMILDRGLQPVWFQPVPKLVAAANLSLQTYRGKPALAWWQGKVTNTGATESGEYVVVDQHYRTIAKLKATGGWVLTVHELAIDGEDAWVTANKNIPMDLSKYGGAYNGALIDSAVQEYNLNTGKLVSNWDALEHIPLSEVQSSLPTNGFPWDAYHVNSIELTGNGKFLVSMRDTWAAYLVDIGTGRIEWTVGRQQIELQVRSRRGLPVAARREAHERLDAHRVRRPLLPAEGRRHVGPGDRAVPRARAEARPERAHGDARVPVRRRRQVQVRIHGRHPDPAERQRVRRLGLGTVLLRVQPLGQAAVRR